MSSIEVQNIRLPGGRAGVAQPQMLVSTVQQRSVMCLSSGWDGADAIATDWFPTGGSKGTVFVKANTESYVLRVEVLMNPVITAEGNIDFDASDKYTLGSIAVDGALGGHLDIDVYQSHFRLVHVAPDAAPSLAFDSFFWRVI